MMGRITAFYLSNVVLVLESISEAAGFTWFFNSVLSLSTENSVLSAVMMLAAMWLARNMIDAYQDALDVLEEAENGNEDDETTY